MLTEENPAPDCGLTLLTDPLIRHDAVTRTPDAAADVDAMLVDGFGCFKEGDYEAVLREDVRVLREEAALRGLDVRGCSLDLGTGNVSVVC